MKYQVLSQVAVSEKIHSVRIDLGVKWWLYWTKIKYPPPPHLLVYTPNKNISPISVHCFRNWSMWAHRQTDRQTWPFRHTFN